MNNWQISLEETACPLLPFFPSYLLECEHSTRSWETEAAGHGGRATSEKDPGAQLCGAAITAMLHMHKLLSQRETTFYLGVAAILAFVTAAKLYPN